MPKGIFGTKVGMTQVFDDKGNFIPVTVIEVSPSRVVRKKTVESDGYEAIQVGVGVQKESRLNKPERGHFAKAGVDVHRHLKELRAEGVEEFDSLEVGSELKADMFSDGDYVDVTGTSKGKGFAGVIKRWNFRRGPSSHGSHFHRSVGSLGDAGAARVFKGRKLPGRMGGAKRTIQGLRIVKVDAERNVLLIEGSVPGAKGSLLEIRQTVKTKG